MKYPIHPEFTLIRILHSQLFEYSNNSNSISSLNMNLTSALARVEFESAVDIE
jgi:hypothetical protein